MNAHTNPGMRPFLLLVLSLAAFVPLQSQVNSECIDRESVVRRHCPVLETIDYHSPFSVGNGGFAFTADITGLQTFGEAYCQNGIPLETLARWCWVEDENPEGFTLDDAGRDYQQADGSWIRLPTAMETAAGHWLRINPRLQPLGKLGFEWDHPDGGGLRPDDIENPRQYLDLWSGVLHSHFSLGGIPVTVITACDPETDTLAVRVESHHLSSGSLRVRLDFPRGHDTTVKNTPRLLWDEPGSHATEQLDGYTLVREISGTRYQVACSTPMLRVGEHGFVFESGGNGVLEFSLRYSPEPVDGVPAPEMVRHRSEAHWKSFWMSGAAVDFAGSTHPLADKLARRMVLSQYLMAIQGVADVPAQESGLTCNTWYGKHHTEMIWWHNAHFILWGRPALAVRNLDWFRKQLPKARDLASQRGLKGARWAKMVGPDGRESPGGNPLIVWNQPHPIYLAELLWRQSPTERTLHDWEALVLESAECMASMLWLDPERGEYVLGPPLWIAQEIHDPAQSQNPSLELAYWHWGLQTAQAWRERLGMERNPEWDHILEHLTPIPHAEGKYVALESHPDTWTNIASRHDHPQMLMPLGFLPETDFVNRETMDRTLTAVLETWDWETKIWGWDYPMVAMTATRLGRAEEALEVLLRDGPNNIYNFNGHCPQGSDRADGQSGGRREIAVYLPANGAFLSALALMLSGWDGSGERPGFPDDGQWEIRVEGLQRLP
jgi:hypothetical protein